jgi:spermidine synthase
MASLRKKMTKIEESFYTFFARDLMLTFLATALFYTETLYPEWGQQMEIQKVLYEEKTDCQDLVIFENSRFGRVLALDGVIQITYADAAIYSEMIVHVPFLAHGNVKRLLIVGGGDGSVLKEALRYKGLEEATVVEIDASVIAMTKKWMPELCKNAFEDPRTRVVIQDAVDYVSASDSQFDVIICDSTDPVGPGAALFTEEFYGNCKRRLAPNGIFVNQNGVPFLQKEELSLTLQNRNPHFKHVGFYLVAVPTYVGGHMALGWASDNGEYARISLETLEERLKQNALEDLFYYTPEVHKASFALPSFTKI